MADEKGVAVKGDVKNNRQVDANRGQLSEAGDEYTLLYSKMKCGEPHWAFPLIVGLGKALFRVPASEESFTV